MWLKGLSYIPKKLRDLYEVNKILAHRPWLLNPQHLQVSSSAVRWKFLEAIPQNTFHARSTSRFPKFGKRKEDFDIKTQFLPISWIIIRIIISRESGRFMKNWGLVSRVLDNSRENIHCSVTGARKLEFQLGQDFLAINSNKFLAILVGTYIPNILK